MPEDATGREVPGGNGGAAVPADALSRQVALNQKLRRMASLSRHDINNQLTIINGYLLLLESGSASIANEEILRILQGATDRIQRILKFTRDYQEIGANPPAWQELGSVIRQARAAIELPGDVRLTVGDSCAPVSICADPLFVKVFSALIDNSLRHGNGVSEIRVSCSPEDGNLAIVYEDNGAGITDAVRSVLFEPGKGKKTGFGLFVARDILAITGMTIAETGRAGTGAKFEIVVPGGGFRTAGTVPPH